MKRSDSFYVRHKLSWMIQWAKLGLDHDILEVGAGLGKFSVPLLERGYRLCCLDLSEAMLADLEQAAPPGARLESIVADIAKVGQTTNSQFDRVIGFNVLHHVFDLEESLEASYGTLRPGGWAAFLEPAAGNPLYYLQIAMTPGMSFRAERGLVDMRAGRVLPAMATVGFVDCESTSFGFLPPFAANTRLGQAFEERFDRSRLLRPATAFRVFRGRRP